MLFFSPLVILLTVYKMLPLLSLSLLALSFLSALANPIPDVTRSSASDINARGGPGSYVTAAYFVNW